MMSWSQAVKIIWDKSTFSEKKTFLVTAGLIVLSAIFALPNLSTDPSKYKCIIEKLVRTRIDHIDYRNRLLLKSQKSILILITDKNEWEISSEHRRYWNQLLDVSNIGKPIKLYFGHNTSEVSEPVQIEIDNKIIYSVWHTIIWNYIMLSVTLLAIIYCVKIIRGYLK